MAKTKPIGVRFDEDILKIMNDEGIASTPQKALNFLTQLFHTYRQELKSKILSESAIPDISLKEIKKVVKGAVYISSRIKLKRELFNETTYGDKIPKITSMPKGLSLAQQLEWREKNGAC